MQYNTTNRPIIIYLQIYIYRVLGSARCLIKKLVVVDNQVVRYELLLFEYYYLSGFKSLLFFYPRT